MARLWWSPDSHTDTPTHPSVTSHRTDRPGPGLRPPLFKPPFPKPVFPWHQLAHWPQGTSFLGRPHQWLQGCAQRHLKILGLVLLPPTCVSHKRETQIKEKSHCMFRNPTAWAFPRVLESRPIQFTETVLFCFVGILVKHWSLGPYSYAHHSTICPYGKSYKVPCSHCSSGPFHFWSIWFKHK